ncbi:MAG: glycosyltransferase family 4 protein [Acidimicrobiales bacterium]
MKPAVHQFLPTFAGRDAIGAHVLHLRALLRGAGFESDIFADDIHTEMKGEARPYAEFSRRSRRGTDDEWLLYHASTGSPMAESLLARANPLILYYHNITQPRLFDRWNPEAAACMRDARVELRRLAPRTTLAIANSSFSEAELVATGFARTAVVPVLVDFTEYAAPPAPRPLARLRRAGADGSAHWLFVGRIAPNKCQHDVVAAFAVYQRLYDPGARLTLVGGRTADSYWRALEAMVADLGISGAVQLAETIPFSTLLAHYRTASVFVCLSEHEGFCVPLLEAMHFGLPVVCFDSSAVGETVGDAGLVLPDKDPLVVAGAVRRVLTDAPLLAGLRAAGEARARHFALAETSRLMLDTITGVLTGNAVRPAGGQGA